MLAQVATRWGCREAGNENGVNLLQCERTGLWGDEMGVGASARGLRVEVRRECLDVGTGRLVALAGIARVGLRVDEVVAKLDPLLLP